MADSDRRHHYIAMLGSCWDDARLAGLRMRLDFADGSQREGMPTAPAMGNRPAEEEIDDTSVPPELLLDDLPVDITRVTAYAVLWDGPEP